MQYQPPSDEDFEAFRRFLHRDARTIGLDFAGTIFDAHVHDYDGYSRYSRPRDVDGVPLVLGDRYFRVTDLLLVVLGASQLGHDRYGIFGAPHALEEASLIEVEIDEDDFDRLVQRLVTIVHEVDPDLVIELNHLELLQRGPAIQARPLARGSQPSASAEIVHSIGIGFTEVHLVRSDEGLALDIEGDRTPVGTAEATVFLNTSEAKLLGWATGARVDRQALLGDLLAEGLRTDIESVFMDKTCFLNAWRATQDPDIEPQRLFDLSCLVHELVFSDSIIVPATTEVPPALDGAVVRSAADEIRISHALHSLTPWNNRADDDVEADGLRQVAAAWSAFFEKEVTITADPVNTTTDSPGSWEYQLGGSDDPDLVSVMLGLPPIGSSRRTNPWTDRDASVAASIHTFRYVLNERRAHLMGVPYVTSALRYPIQAVRLRNADHFRRVTEAVLAERRSPGVPSASPFLEHLRLPDPLAIVCSRVGNPGEILGAAMALRDEWAPVRDVLRSGRAEGMDDVELIRKLRGELGSEDRGAAIDMALVKAASVASTLGFDLSRGLVVAKLAEPLDLGQRATRVFDAIRRPHLRVIRRFETAAQDGATTAALLRLWGTEPTRRWFETLHRLSDLVPFETAKMQAF